MRTITTSAGTPLELDGDVLAVIETGLARSAAAAGARIRLRGRGPGIRPPGGADVGGRTAGLPEGKPVHELQSVRERAAVGAGAPGRRVRKNRETSWRFDERARATRSRDGSMSDRRQLDELPGVAADAALLRQRPCAAHGRRDARPGGPGSRWPTSDKSPITSRILWRTNSSSKRSGFNTPVSPSTTAFSSEPPSARPRCRSISTSFRKPNVRAGAIWSTNTCFVELHRLLLMPKHGMIEGDGVADLEAVEGIERDALVALLERIGCSTCSVLRGAFWTFTPAS